MRIVKGKEVVNMLPPLVWHKGSALRWLIELLDSIPAPGTGGIFPVYIGDDVTDEDAFPVARETGIAARVGPPKRGTAAEYSIADTAEVESTLRAMLDRIPARWASGSPTWPPLKRLVRGLSLQTPRRSP